MLRVILVRMNRLMVAVCAIFAVLDSGSAYPSQLDDVAARDAAVASIKSRPGGIAADCPKTRRKEQLEDDLFALRREMVLDGKLNESLFIYEVVGVGCYSVEDSALVIHTIDHPGTFGYVAVDKINGKTYRLWSDPDALKAFNQLVSDLGIAVHDENAALRLAGLYRQAVTGPYEGNAIHDTFQLKQLSEQSFYRAFPEAGWSRRFSEWWTRFQGSKRVNFERSARKVPDGWIITGKSFEGFRLTIPRTTVAGCPTVLEWSIRVSPSGQVVELPSRVVFR
ncbi:MAG TPA: hypothetical protein VN622_16585 [Clostridia bacterium]|nr:hypothetical protein [Clostridia bacterium]